MTLTREAIEERLTALRAGLASIQLDLARQDGAVQSMEWALAQLDEPDSQPESDQPDGDTA